MRLAVLGGGSWGTTVANLVARRQGATEVAPGDDGLAEPWPPAADDVIHLVETNSSTERDLIERWVSSTRPENVRRHQIVHVDTARSRVRHPRSWTLDPTSTAAVVPLRATWRRGDRRRATPRLRDLLAGDPHRPPPLVARYLAWRHPERARLLAGPAATICELREQYAVTHGSHDDRGVEDLTSYVVRRAGIALDVRERRLEGRRYKVPRAVVDSCRHHPSFRRAVRGIALEEGRPEAEVAAEAASYLREMAATPTRLFIDWTGVFTRWIISLAYREVVVDPVEVDRVRELVREHPCAFLFTHKSHVDGMALISVLYDNDITAPHQLGGINMAFRGLATLSRRGGTIFIRRSFGDNRLYRATLQQYLGYLMEKRFPFSWAFEGTRSRTGKLMPPRYGILKYVTEAAQAAETRDLHLVPVAISYDLIGEVDEYRRQEAGLPKRQESFGWFVGYLRKLRAPMGRLYVDFADPVVFDGSATSEALNLPDIAFEVARRVNGLVPVTLPALLCMTLLGRAPRPMSLDELDAELRSTIGWLRSHDVRLAGRFDETEAEQLEQLANIVFERGLIDRRGRGPTTTFSIADAQYPVAGYYRNTIVHYFVDKAIAEIALASVVGVDPSRRVDTFWEEAANLRDLLKFEFFHSASSAFTASIEAEMERADPAWRRVLAGPSGDVERLLERMQPIVAPAALLSFVEGYWVVADRLAQLADGETLTEDDALEQSLATGDRLCREGRVTTRASIGQQLFRGAYRLLDHRGLLAPGDGAAARRRVLADDLQRLAATTASLATLDPPAAQERNP